MPVGRNLNFHEKYKNEDHWRYTKNDRCYDIILLPYDKSFVPQEGTYDILLPSMHGMKWEIVQYFLNTYDYSGYEYVGFFDDDIITNYQSLNFALKLAEEHHMNIFQLSLSEGSSVNEPITKKIEERNLLYTITNYVECMCPIFHISMIPGLKEILSYCNPWIGWTIDLIYSRCLRTHCNIIHAVSMFHTPPAPEQWLEVEPGGFILQTSYKRDAALQEAINLSDNIFPTIYKKMHNKPPPPFTLWKDPTTKLISKVYYNG